MFQRTVNSNDRVATFGQIRMIEKLFVRLNCILGICYYFVLFLPLLYIHSSYINIWERQWSEVLDEDDDGSTSRLIKSNLIRLSFCFPFSDLW